MYRVYDNKRRCWVDDIFYSPNDEPYVSKSNMFHVLYLTSVDDTRYICQKDIGLIDKNENVIFEGDICKHEESGMIGLIAYSPEQASYLLFNNKEMCYYPIGMEVCKKLIVIGNIMENRDLIK